MVLDAELNVNVDSQSHNYLGMNVHEMNDKVRRGEYESSVAVVIIIAIGHT